MVRIRDEAGLFSASDVASLQEVAGKLPFDVHLVTSTSVSSKSAFEGTVSQAVDGPNVVAIGIDPTHRFTAVHFGKETGIPASQWSAVISAGNGSFKEARWAEGVGKITERAASAKQQSTTLQPTPESTPEGEASHAGWWIFGGITVFFVAIFLSLWWRNKKADERSRMDALAAERRRASVYRAAASVPTASRPRASRPASAPSTVVVNTTDPSNDLATGYVLGSMNHTPAPAPAPSPKPASSPSSSHSSGGSSSTWDSGGYSAPVDTGGGGFDAGGGGSSW